MVYDLFIGENFQGSKNIEAWSPGVEYDDLITTIENVLSNADLNEGKQLIIIVRPEYEGG